MRKATNEELSFQLLCVRANERSNTFEGIIKGVFFANCSNWWKATSNTLTPCASSVQDNATKKLVHVVATAHPFLPKPCQPGSLIGSIQAALNLQDSIPGPELKKAVSAFRGVPSPSSNIECLKALTIDSDDFMQQLRESHKSDIGIALKLLLCCDGSLFGRPNPGTSIQNAVEPIRGDLLLYLIQAGVLRSIENPLFERFLTVLYEHSVEVALDASLQQTIQTLPGSARLAVRCEMLAKSCSPFTGKKSTWI